MCFKRGTTNGVFLSICLVRYVSWYLYLFRRLYITSWEARRMNSKFSCFWFKIFRQISIAECEAWWMGYMCLIWSKLLMKSLAYILQQLCIAEYEAQRSSYMYSKLTLFNSIACYRCLLPSFYYGEQIKINTFNMWITINLHCICLLACSICLLRPLHFSPDKLQSAKQDELVS